MKLIFAVLYVSFNDGSYTLLAYKRAVFYIYYITQSCIYTDFVTGHDMNVGHGLKYQMNENHFKYPEA